jgi:hypothetical protein
MQNDENTPEVELEENETYEMADESVEETEEVAEVETEEQSKEVDWKSEALKWQAIAKRKAKQVAKPVAKTTETINNTLSREEAILIAKGMDDESISQLQSIAKGKAISLLDAEKDPLFVAYYDKRQAELKAERARLGVSKGSGQKQNKPDFTAVGLSEEEHKRLWKEATNQ